MFKGPVCVTSALWVCLVFIKESECVGGAIMYVTNGLRGVCVCVCGCVCVEGRSQR